MRNSKQKKKIGRAWREILVRIMTHLPRAQRIVLKELVSMGNQRGYCWPSVKTLAEQTGYCQKTVQRALKELERKKLIRRRRKVRSDGSQGVYEIAITLPLGVQCTGHGRPSEVDRMSALKENYQNKSKAVTCEVRSLEDDLLKLFDRVINEKSHPELLSLYEVTSWLFDRLDEPWPQLKSLILNRAIELRDELHQSGKRLHSWSQLVDRLGARSSGRVSEPGSPVPDRNGKGRFGENAARLGINSSDPRLAMLLSEFRIEQKGVSIRLVTESPSAASQLVQDYFGILRKSARDHGTEIAVVHRDKIIFSTGGR